MKKSAVVAVVLAISFLIGTLTGCSVFDSYDPLKNSENIEKGDVHSDTETDTESETKKNNTEPSKEESSQKDNDEESESESQEKEETLYKREGDYIWFGEFPQTLKANNVTVGNAKDSRGYYLGSDGCYYAKVTATPLYSSYKFSTGAAVNKGSVYYFKVEPIRWRILSEGENGALILCDSIIASGAYNSVGDNLFIYSDIRQRLNGEFYQKAFTSAQRTLIKTSNVVNDAASTGGLNNEWVCANTQDKVFLLSYVEATSSEYGLSSQSSRMMRTSDYSRATGAYVSDKSAYSGNGVWLLRSSHCDYEGHYVRAIKYDGNDEAYCPYDTYGGVVPAMRINLK